MHFICRYHHTPGLFIIGDSRALRCRIGNVNRTTFLLTEEQFSGRSTFLAATAFIVPIKDASSPFHAYRNYSDTLIKSIRAGRAASLFETADSIFSVKFRTEVAPLPLLEISLPTDVLPIWWHNIKGHGTTMAAVSFQSMTRPPLETE